MPDSIVLTQEEHDRLSDEVLATPIPAVLRRIEFFVGQFEYLERASALARVRVRDEVNPRVGALAADGVSLEAVTAALRRVGPSFEQHRSRTPFAAQDRWAAALARAVVRALASRQWSDRTVVPWIVIELLPRLAVHVPDGERRELVVTVDGNPFLPLLRYRTGDTGSLTWVGGRRAVVGLEGRAPVSFRAADGRVVPSVDLTQQLQHHGGRDRGQSANGPTAPSSRGCSAAMPPSCAHPGHPARQHRVRRVRPVCPDHRRRARQAASVLQRPGRCGLAAAGPAAYRSLPACRVPTTRTAVLDGGMTLHADDYQAARSRYSQTPYRRCGTSGLDLPAVSLGLWHNFGDDVAMDNQRATLRRAFDLGVTHFDLANNYGPPYGSAERNFGTIFAQDFKRYRDELIISSKAGYDMWPGPYGQGGGSRKYLLSSLDQSLERMGLDYVDIFYSHRFDETTPLEETMGALDSAVRQGKALYVGISSYSGARTAEAVEILRAMGTPLLIHQPSYSMLNRWIEEDLLDVLGVTGTGCIAFSPLAQGMLSDKYLKGIPSGSRASQGKSLSPKLLTDQSLKHIRALNRMAKARGQSLAQMALAWALRDKRVTSVLIGASSVTQLEDSVGATSNLDFSAEELDKIDRYAVESGINLWKTSSSH